MREFPKGQVKLSSSTDGCGIQQEVGLIGYLMSEFLMLI